MPDYVTVLVDLRMSEVRIRELKFENHLKNYNNNDRHQEWLRGFSVDNAGFIMLLSRELFHNSQFQSELKRINSRGLSSHRQLSKMLSSSGLVKANCEADLKYILPPTDWSHLQQNAYSDERAMEAFREMANTLVDSS